MAKNTKAPDPWTPTVLDLNAPTPSPPAHCLPILHPSHNASNPLTIEVDGIPERNGATWTWTVKKRPLSQIEAGQPVVLITGGSRSGTGLIEAVSELRRHWITWSLAGSPGIYGIRAPTSWSRLAGRDRTIHTTLYHLLPPLPPPHLSLTSNMLIRESNESPYEFESDEEEEAEP
ncbi:uncharacterized protein B0H18DRAFT_954902 [Fomitopsis serialis]|uniref:uncharacterized protein n=1 Tax=Fomitopsis serialis TaxID=139415 RepID=UPI0020072A32|nr:uncharacterized protein B0H18DRAFT_954902 [Neoantrodia serialis]KAH9926013.1 hypothetical protein B0H18DRAFT_954902 [Neoantrodia serialis]